MDGAKPVVVNSAALLGSSQPVSIALPVAAAPTPVATTVAATPATPASAKKEENKAPYPPPATTTTQKGPMGIGYDFNLGARIILPTRAEGKWRIRLRDQDTGNILFETATPGSVVMSSKRYYIRHQIQVWDGEGPDAKEVLNHQYSAKGQNVLIQFPIGTLGDMVAWFPYALKFQRKHDCKLTITMSDKIIPLFKDAYPHVRFIPHEEVKGEDYYATYCFGLFFDDADHVWQPCDFRHVGLHKTAGYILGVDPEEERPIMKLPDESRPMAEPYVCIAVQSSSQPKYWNNPFGWRDTVKFLNDIGYKVVCIDQKATHGTGLVWNHIPNGTIDRTGDEPLTERARWLRHADFFIGTSSGLSWLAWAADVPVVLISGFTHPTNEFNTPYRVINYHACNSCWNDLRYRFQHTDFLWCPRHAGTERQFECSKLITSEQVKNTIELIPAVQKQKAAHEAAKSTAPAEKSETTSPKTQKQPPETEKEKTPLNSVKLNMMKKQSTA